MSIKHKLIIAISAMFTISGLLLFVAAFDISVIYKDSIYAELNKSELSVNGYMSLTTLGETVLFVALATFILMLVIIFISLFCIGFILIRGIISPLNKLSKIASEIKEGNLDFEIKYNSNDEFGKVFEEFDDMRLRLKLSLEKQIALEKNRKEMIVSIVHDIKTPVTSISGHTQGLIDGIADTAEKQNKYLLTILQKSRDVDKLVNDLFLFSKLDLEQVPLNLQVIEAEEYITSVFQEIELENSNMKINVIVLTENNGKIEIDPMHFKRVFQNITQNSIKYKRNACANITVEIRNNEKNMIIKITDDGIGMNETEVDKIFERFFRSDEARTTSGSGLGLSISKQLVELHHGKIWARSKGSEGLSIYISLPCETN